MFSTLRQWFLGKPKDPLSNQTHNAMALTILFAWIGLGADGLSSACYGPEQSFLALGQYHGMSLWLVLLMTVTVFIIAFSYNCVISLFPDGGGGYKIATRLLGRKLGLIAGIALLLDYILTIVISVVSGTNAVFSFLPVQYYPVRILVDVAVIFLLAYLNMRGMKESIKFLLPVFLGFVLLHIFIIFYGIGWHYGDITQIIHQSHAESVGLFQKFGAFFAVALFLHAYAQGGGTYTGLEAVSNNVNTLSEPKVKTGKWTMLLMAISLSFTAGGILILYSLWHVSPVAGRTLNAVAFSAILGNSLLGHITLIVILLFEAGLLYAAANTGFLGGPAVLANMARDQWFPEKFAGISNRLVKQNGILSFCFGSILILFITDAHVKTLVVLYSISVFLAFTLALAGLVKYYGKRFLRIQFFPKLVLVTVGCCICLVIFVIALITNFLEGGWLLVLLFAIIAFFCRSVYVRYYKTNRLLRELANTLCAPLKKQPSSTLFLADQDRVAVIFVFDRGVGMHTLMTIKRLFGDYYSQFIFIGVGVIDSFSVVGKEKIRQLERQLKHDVNYLKRFCLENDMPAESQVILTTDPVEKIVEVSHQVRERCAKSVFFVGEMVFPNGDWLIKWIHNQIAPMIQQKLYESGLYTMALPVTLKWSKS